MKSKKPPCDFVVYKKNPRTNLLSPQTDRHPNAIGAMREAVCAFGEVSAEASDTLIRRHWPSFRRNHNYIVQRVLPEPP